MAHRDENATGTCRIRIEFGRANLSSEELDSLREGDVVELEAFADDYVDVCADGRLVARGRAVVVDGKLGVRVQEAIGEARAAGARETSLT